MVLALAAPLSAQDVQQTPEGAQRFFALIANRGWEIIPGYDQLPRGVVFEHRVSAARADGDCLTVFETNGLTYVLDGQRRRSVTDPDFDRTRLDKAMAKIGVAIPPFRIDWSTVVSIQPVETGSPWFASDGVARRLLITADSGQLVFRFPTPELAARARYAAEFLKSACDMTAETGF